MRDSDAMLLLGLAGLAMLTRSKSCPTDAVFDDGWVWPVPPMRPWRGGPVYNPEVSQEFKDPDHLGVDIMYRRKSKADLLTAYRPGTPDGTSQWFAPSGTPVIAARAGKVWSVQKTTRGIAVVLDHAKPFATFYQHLESAIVRPGAYVTVGQPLGVMGFDPTDDERLRHLHFAVWYKGAGDDASIDITAAMAKWPRVP